MEYHVSESSDIDLLRDSDSNIDSEGVNRAVSPGDVASTDDDDGSDAMAGFASKFCVNCTGPLSPYEDICEDCGHSAVDDALLFDTATAGSQRQAHASFTKSVVLLYDERMELHDEGERSPHPERPDRIRAVMSRLLMSGLEARCSRIACREATRSELAAVHTDRLVKLVEDASWRAQLNPELGVSITPDTYVNQHTHLCARLAAGGAAQIATIVASGEAPHGAAIVRPPGHHAESGMAMGFCFFNNAAVAARAAQSAGAQRVIILDWDIHHGNGTQHIFEDDPSVLYISLHRYDGGQFYPGTGGVGEAGLGAGEGFTVNVPWDAADMGNGDYLTAFHQLLLPITYEYNPDLIIVSAGFDAADGDPIGQCRVTPECFAHMTSMLKAVAPTVLLLEGGYNLQSTAVSTEACLRVLLGEEPGCLPGPRHASYFGWKAIQEAIQVQSRYWNCLRPPQHPSAHQSRDLRASQPTLICKETIGDDDARPSLQPSETLQHSSRNKSLPTRAGSAGDVTSGKCRPHKPHRSNVHTAAAKCQLLLAIHKRAMRAFWKRQRRLAKQPDS